MSPAVTASDLIEDATVRVPSDLAKQDHELVCGRCDVVLCDVEDGDTLGTLMRVVADHGCGAGR